MVRIGGSTPEGQHIKETDYFTKLGEYKVDKEASETMINSFMYKLCYYRFGGLYTQQVKWYSSLKNQIIIQFFLQIGWDIT